MSPWLVLLLLAICFLALWLYGRRERVRHARFQDSVADPVFGRLVWQGYGDGDWWQAELNPGATPITFCLGGSDRPDPALVAQAQALASSFGPFQQTLAHFLREEALRRPGEAEAIMGLALRSVVLFPRWPDDEPDGYSGTFVILQPQPGEAEWRCDYDDGRFSNLRVWG